MPEFTCDGAVRHGFGFFNPNHAAALVCALAPFAWGWRGGWRWLGRAAFAALAVMLALTYSRTGFAVMCCEMAAWRLAARRRPDGAPEENRRARLCGAWWSVAAVGLVVALAAAFLAPRLRLDGAAANRPAIWLAGLRLAAANPRGVGLGNSGELASAFMLPSGIEVRTLVNSHLTLLAELGWAAGLAWAAFVGAALAGGKGTPRARIAFGALAASAFASSVFDWHVLFDFREMGGRGAANFALGWATLLMFLGVGAAMAWRGARCGWTRGGAAFALSLPALCLAALLAAHRPDGAPRVVGGHVEVGKGGARVFRDAEWTLANVAARFPEGARFCLRPGVPEGEEDGGEVWLFGDVAESDWRFPNARVTVVSPPEFYAQ